PEPASGPAAALAGYTRLHILSFERLASFVFDRLNLPPPRMLSEEGRLMVLRALIARRRKELKLFRASARLTGFAQQLSEALHELQRQQLAPESLAQLAAQLPPGSGLALKLQDLAVLLSDYLDWIRERGLQDGDSLLAAAAEALGDGVAAPPVIDGLWLDGFAEFSPHELGLLAALLPHCRNATLAFCLDGPADPGTSWLSHWSLAQRHFEECRRRLSLIPGATLKTEILERDAAHNRFAACPALARLELCWADDAVASSGAPAPPGSAALRFAACANAEAEAALAAGEILRFARAGGRFREASVMVRNLESYHHAVRRVFGRFGIPFFLDRREAVAHHPLAELTRSALRVVSGRWQREDWFAALKTGLVPADERDIDRLENEALARGWNGDAWQEPLPELDDPALRDRLERVRLQVLPPFQALALRIAAAKDAPTGPELAAALREFWNELDIAAQLDRWSESAATPEDAAPASVHATVWEQMNRWLENLELAFPRERLKLRDWLPVLESGLSQLTVGLIPPALDQVLVGAIDRSRNPDVRLAIVLGLNEGVFPAQPHGLALLTESDQSELEQRGLALGLTARRHLGRERYLAYIACTRPRERLVLTCSESDPDDQPLNPSPFLSRARQLFPSVPFEIVPAAPDWRDSEHASELLPHWLTLVDGGALPPGAERLAALPGLSDALERVGELRAGAGDERLSPAWAERLYGPVLRTSVSRLEQFAACPFRFFVHSGLRAEERKLFELDVREQGSFQHDVLRLYHEKLVSEGRRWRDLEPPAARERIGSIAAALVANYRQGLLQASEEARFTARMMTESLQDFIEVLTGWMRSQYQFDPVAVELVFGGDGAGAGAGRYDLGGGHLLQLFGRIDRVDLCRREDGSADVVVLDYKSSRRKLDAALMAHGIQLQLPVYLEMLRRWPDPEQSFGAARLVPSGMFFVKLRGDYPGGKTRREALDNRDEERRLAYRHLGRFDSCVLHSLDSREGAASGDQFAYRLNKSGSLHKGSRDPMERADFLALLDRAAERVREIGQAVYGGDVRLDPYRHAGETACETCDYAAICRVDRWTQVFRVLKDTAAEVEE
ncbi:MAG: PD-(D/E)XK nuclease family protein, partial [Verrucomicrobiota bacterium]